MPKKRGFRRNISMCSDVNGPSTFWITKSWSTSDSPAKSGCPSVSSPMMQPRAQMSTSLP